MGGSDLGGEVRQAARRGGRGGGGGGAARERGGPGAGGPASGTDSATAAWTARFTGQFFKTKMCSFWQKGQCMRGSACKYAHGESELNAMPDLTNTALCHQMLAYGKCDIPGCHFAHSPEALRATGNFYKTAMCSFHRQGRCSLGQHCRHAHTQDELRRAAAHVVRRTSGQGKVGRLGYDSGARRLARVEDSEDEFGEVPPWERTMTTPAMARPRPGSDSSRASYAIDDLALVRDASSITAGGADSEDELGEAPVWQRTVTTPAGLALHQQQPQPVAMHSVQALPWERTQMVPPTVTPAELRPYRANYSLDDRPRIQDSVAGGADSGDELGEAPAWKRTVTTPAGLGPYQPLHSMQVQQACAGLPPPTNRQLQGQDSDDEFGPMQPWQRTVSVPSYMGPNQRANAQFRDHVAMQRVNNFDQQSQPVFAAAGRPCQRAFALPRPDDMEDQFDNIGDLWFRMQTMPPQLPVVQEAQQGYSFKSGEASTMAAVSAAVSVQSTPSSTPDQWSRQVSAAAGIIAEPMVDLQHASSTAFGDIIVGSAENSEAAGNASISVAPSAPTLTGVPITASTPVVVTPMQVLQVPAVLVSAQALSIQSSVAGSANFTSQVAVPAQNPAIMKQLEAKLLLSAMPDCYED